MLNKKIEDALNKQLNEELYSAYIYLSMAACLENKNFNGMATWLKKQAQEEVKHAMKFYSFINDRAGKVKLSTIAAPPNEWENPLAAFEDAYKHECKISSYIHNLLNLAMQESDHPTCAFLHWFVNEQVEEEATTLNIVEKLQMVSNHNGALLMLDKELGKRE